MKTKLVLVFAIFMLVIAGCARKNNTSVTLRYIPESKELDIDLAASALYFTELRTITSSDTMEISIYTKFVYFTTSKKNRRANRILTP